MMETRFLKRCVLGVMISILFVFAGSSAWAAGPGKLISESVKTLKEMSLQKDAGTMGDLLSRAKGVVVFPSVAKAGLIFAGTYGEGLILKRDGSGRWYGPSFVKIIGASWGLQIGAQSIALVLVITNDRGLEGFMADNVKLDGALAVAAGPVGRSGELGTDLNLKASIYSYSMTKGLFAGISLEGAAVNVDTTANNEYWKTTMPARKALSRKASDSRILPLTAQIDRIARKR